MNIESAITTNSSITTQGTKNSQNANSANSGKFSDELSGLQESAKKQSSEEEKELQETEDAKKSQECENEDKKIAESEQKDKEVEEAKLKEEESEKNSEADNSVKNDEELKQTELKAIEEREIQEREESLEFKSIEEREAQQRENDNEQNPDEVQKAIIGLNSIMQEFNKNSLEKKQDINKEDNDMINNIDANRKEIAPQISLSMGFAENNQNFSSLMEQNEENSQQLGNLKSTQAELAEEAEILSTMDENIAIANKNNIQKNITVTQDVVIMNEADVEVFATLVQNGEVDLNNLAPEAAAKSVKVSQTLADMLANAKEKNQPLRVDFDNDISVIIRVSREGKLSADFLPSSQIAEAYLKENLPLLKQRFDENNIDYDELNHRNQKERDKDNNRKKEHQNE